LFAVQRIEYQEPYEVGTRMGIRQIPESYEKLQQFAYDYERDNFRFAETNQRIGTA
jgi:hypothetical protein